MKKSILLVAATALIAIGVVSYFYTIHAQTPQKGLTIIPTNLELNLIPGQETTKTVTLYNTTNSAVDIVPEVRNFSAQGEEGEVELTSADTGYSLASWTTVSPQKVTIKKDDHQDFTFTINVPLNVEPGGHFGSIVLSTVPPPQGTLKSSGAFVIQQVAALVLAKIPGKVEENTRLESFTTDKPFYPTGPVQFTVRIKNLSTIHLKPTGNITVKDWFGRKTVVPVDQRNILPGAIRRLGGVFDQKLMIGGYTANLSMFYGSENKNITGSVTFYEFPVKEALIALAILVVLIVFRKRIIKAIRIIIIGK